MNEKALFLELLISGFFAVACFKARAEGPGEIALRPRDLLRLTDRVERMSRSRWQWFAMAGILVLVRLQTGVPMVVELTALMQLIVFLALPVAKQSRSFSGRAAVCASMPVSKGRIGRRRQAGLPVSRTPAS
ncbi:MAG TPA: hypothetical protein VMU92_12940 [Acidobacteriaceae bacterium]|nr:hypothetical protein [Acidobacteriaceae bacterium]